MKKVKLCWGLSIVVIFLLLLIPTKTQASYYNYFKSNKYKITEAEEKKLTNLDDKNVTVKNILANMSHTLGNDYVLKAYDAKRREMTEKQKMGTNSTVELVSVKYQYFYDTVTVILYGDVNGDGSISSADALAIIKNKTGKVRLEDENYIEAGRVTEGTRKKGTIPASADALMIIKHKLGKAKINQYYQMQAKITSYEDLYKQLEQCNTNLKFETTNKEIETYYKKLQEVVATYCKSDMSQVTKALVLHDYLAAGTKLHYRVSSYNKDDNESNICNIGKTMNQTGFANTYTCLLGLAGIPSKIRRDRYANSPDAAINEVTIDGQIYYVACGADSYISQVEGKGKLRRYFFLRNTEQLKESFWEREAYFNYTPSTTENSASTKYYGVRWPEYRKALNYKNNETKLVTGKTIVRNISELQEAVLAKKDYIVDRIDASSESTYEVDEFCKRVVAKYIKPGMSEAEKALTIHDFICSNFMRNDHEAYRERSNISNADYDREWSYYKNSLLSGMGDCISATSSFNTLCAYVGLETKAINQHQVSNPFGLGNHHWSLVKIDGEWYHCDCEGGDYYEYGEVSRTWFLCSDRGMRVGENTIEPCTSTKYDGYQWPEFKGITYYQDKTGITTQTVPATSIWIKQREKAAVGDEFDLRLRIFPYGSSSKAIYSSSNPKVATIDVNGKVKVLATGTTTITVKVNNITKSFTLKPYYTPDRIKISEMTLKVGETKKATYQVEPTGAVFENGKWSISDTNIATVDENGNVTAIAEGYTYIYFRYEYETARNHVYTGNFTRVRVTK